MINNQDWFDAPYSVDSEYIHAVEDTLESAREWLIEVLQGLYGDKSLDYMEHALEEVCSYLNVPFPKKEMQITEKNPYFVLGVRLSKNQLGE